MRHVSSKAVSYHASFYHACMVHDTLGIKQGTIDFVGYVSAHFDCLILDWGIFLLWYCH